MRIRWRTLFLLFSCFLVVKSSSKIDEILFETTQEPIELTESPQNAAEEHRIRVEELEPDLAKSIFSAVSKNPLERTTTVSSLRGKRAIETRKKRQEDITSNLPNHPLPDSDYEVISSNIDPVALEEKSEIHKNESEALTKLVAKADIFDDEDEAHVGIDVNGKEVSVHSFENVEFVEISDGSSTTTTTVASPESTALTTTDSTPSTSTLSTTTTFSTWPTRGRSTIENLITDEPLFTTTTTTVEPPSTTTTTTTTEAPTTTTTTTEAPTTAVSTEGPTEASTDALILTTHIPEVPVTFLEEAPTTQLAQAEEASSSAPGSWSIKIKKVETPNLNPGELGSSGHQDHEILREGGQEVPNFDFTEVHEVPESHPPPRALEIVGINGHGFYPERKILDGMVQKVRKIVSNNFDPALTQNPSLLNADSEGLFFPEVPARPRKKKLKKKRRNRINKKRARLNQVQVEPTSHELPQQPQAAFQPDFQAPLEHHFHIGLAQLHQQHFGQLPEALQGQQGPLLGSLDGFQPGFLPAQQPQSSDFVLVPDESRPLTVGDGVAMVQKRSKRQAGPPPAPILPQFLPPGQDQHLPPRFVQVPQNQPKNFHQEAVSAPEVIAVGQGSIGAQNRQKTLENILARQGPQKQNVISRITEGDAMKRPVEDEDLIEETATQPRHVQIRYSSHSRETVERKGFSFVPQLQPPTTTLQPHSDPSSKIMTEEDLEKEYMDIESLVATTKNPNLDTNSLRKDLPEAGSQDKSVDELGAQKVITSVNKEVSQSTHQRIGQPQFTGQAQQNPQNFQQNRNFFTVFRQGSQQQPQVPPQSQGTSANKEPLQPQLPLLVNLPNIHPPTLPPVPALSGFGGQQNLPPPPPPPPPMPQFGQGPVGQFPQQTHQPLPDHLVNQPIALEPGTRLHIFHDANGRQFVVLGRNGAPPQGPPQGAPQGFPQAPFQGPLQPPPPPPTTFIPRLFRNRTVPPRNQPPPHQSPQGPPQGAQQQRQHDLPQSPLLEFEKQPTRRIHDGVVMVNPQARLVQPTRTWPTSDKRPNRVRNDQIKGTYDQFGTTQAVHGSIPPTAVTMHPVVGQEQNFESRPQEAAPAAEIFPPAAVELITEVVQYEKVKVTTPKPSAYPRIQFGWNELVDELNPDAVTHPTQKPTPPPETPATVATTTGVLESVTNSEITEDSQSTGENLAIEKVTTTGSLPVASTEGVLATESTEEPTTTILVPIHDETSIKDSQKAGWNEKHAWETLGAIYDEPIPVLNEAVEYKLSNGTEAQDSTLASIVPITFKSAQEDSTPLTIQKPDEPILKAPLKPAIDFDADPEPEEIRKADFVAQEPHAGIDPVLNQKIHRIFSRNEGTIKRSQIIS